MSYTTIEKIGEELGGYTINAGSIPSSSTVTGWIEEAEQVIDDITNTTYTTATASSELYDYDGSGVLFLANAPTISINELKKEVKGIGAESSEWEVLLEGRTSDKDFYVYLDEGEIRFHGTNTPTKGYKNIMVSYDYGMDSVPGDIERLSTLMVARRVIMSVINKSATEEGGSVSVGTIKVDDPSKFGHDHLKEMKAEELSIIDHVGRFKTYRFKRVYDNY